MKSSDSLFIRGEQIMRGVFIVKKKIVLIPQYMKDFHCIGSDCEDNCCYGWTVAVDDDTFKKYRKASESSLKPLLDKNVTRNRSNPSSENYAKIKMCDNGNCPFLGEDKLCSIHSKLGESHLSKVCTVYPRITNVVNGVYEKSLSISCPEAARVILLNSNIMEFDEVEEVIEDERNIIHNILDSNSRENSNSIRKYFWPLRIFTISLLQNRDFSLSDRLIILGLFMKNIQKTFEDKNVHKIPEIIEEYNKIIENNDLRDSLNDIPSNLNIQMELMKEFNDQRFTTKFSQNGKAYIECVAEFLVGIQYSDDAKVEDIGERYKEAYLNYYEPFMREHEYILENFLVNHVFREMFPVVSKGGVFDDYVKLVIHYSLIKMLLIGMTAYNKKLDEALIVRLVYSYSRAVEHHKTFFDNTFKLFKANGYNTMAYMAILIKHEMENNVLVKV